MGFKTNLAVNLNVNDVTPERACTCMSGALLTVCVQHNELVGADDDNVL